MLRERHAPDRLFRRIGHHSVVQNRECALLNEAAFVISARPRRRTRNLTLQFLDLLKGEATVFIDEQLPLPEVVLSREELFAQHFRVDDRRLEIRVLRHLLVIIELCLLHLQGPYTLILLCLASFYGPKAVLSSIHVSRLAISDALVLQFLQFLALFEEQLDVHPCIQDIVFVVDGSVHSERCLGLVVIGHDV